MKITFLGTNGWFDTACGNTLCVLIETANEYIVLDAGSGFVKLNRYITAPKPIYLMLSHFHIDHIVGLHTLMKFDFPKGLTIVGQPGTQAALATFVNPPFSSPLARNKYPVTIHDLPDASRVLPFRVKALPLIHASPCYGYRLEVEQRVITYCTDTGYCANAVTLARDADLLITECARKPGQPVGDWPHLDPASAARIAREANAQQLALVHFDAAVYTKLEDRALAENAARETFANVFATRDEMSVTV